MERRTISAHVQLGTKDETVNKRSADKGRTAKMVAVVFSLLHTKAKLTTPALPTNTTDYGVHLIVTIMENGPIAYILVTRNHARTEEPAKTQGWIPTSVSVRADSKEPIAKKTLMSVQPLSHVEMEQVAKTPEEDTVVLVLKDSLAKIATRFMFLLNAKIQWL